MAKLEIIFNYKAEIFAAVDKAAASDVECWWRFERHGQVEERQAGDEWNIMLQMGMTLGANGRVFLCTKSDSDMILLRMTAGI